MLLDLDLPLHLYLLLCSLFCPLPLFSIVRAYVSLPITSFKRVSLLNKLFFTMLIDAFPSSVELVNKISKGFHDSRKDLKRIMAYMSSSMLCLVDDSCIVKPLNSFKCFTTDYPSFNFNLSVFWLWKLFLGYSFFWYIFSRFFQRVCGSLSLET